MAKKKKDAGIAPPERSLRDEAEEQLARSPKISPDIANQTPEKLIHELQVHQLELETQAEDLRRAQFALEESRDKYLDLYEFAPLGYLTLNDKTRVTGANLTGAMLLGVERNTLVNHGFGRFIAPEDLDRWDRYFVSVRQQGEKQTSTLTLIRADGSRFPARLESTRLTGKSDGTTTIRVAISDITDIRQAEEALRETNKKLNLLSSITRHDINNQLLAINGFLDLLHMEIPDPAFESYFTQIMNASARITAMIRFTKEYEKIGIHAPVWQNTHTLVETAAKEAPLGSVRLTNTRSRGTEILADPLIAKVFYNLMENAVRHGGTITNIRFTSEEKNGTRAILCEDDGTGVPALEKEKIFARGFGKNTGLGLFLAREILSITGITITENGTPGKGARFEITVPNGMWRVVEANRAGK
jgi:PAS domain S-box-containing protein